VNLYPGQGLGFDASKLIASGMGAMTVTEVPIPITPDDPYYAGGGAYSSVSVYDNAYSKPHDDDEIVEILHILFEVIDE